MQSSIRIAAAHALDERADDVVVLIAVLVVPDGRMLDGGFDCSEVDARVRAHGRGTCRVERGEAAPGIAGTHANEIGDCLIGDRNFVGQASFVRDRSSNNRLETRIGQRLQRHHDASGQQGGDDREAGVLGGRGDERDPSVLHSGQQGVLLALAETVHLVNEENRAEVVQPQSLSSVVDNRPHILHARGHRRQFGKHPSGLPRDQGREGGLSRSRRPPQHDGHSSADSPGHQ